MSLGKMNFIIKPRLTEHLYKCLDCCRINQKTPDFIHKSHKTRESVVSREMPRSNGQKGLGGSRVIEDHGRTQIMMLNFIIPQYRMYLL